MTPLLDSKRQPTSSGSSFSTPCHLRLNPWRPHDSTRPNTATQRSGRKSLPGDPFIYPTSQQPVLLPVRVVGEGASSRASGKIYDPRNHLLVLGAQTHIVTQLRGNNSNDVENCVKRVHYFLPLLLGRWRSPREELWPCPTCPEKKEEE